MTRTTSTSPCDGPMTNPLSQQGREPADGAKPAFLAIRLSVLIFLGFTILGAWFPLLSQHLGNLGFTPEQTAWALATNALAALIAPLIWGQIADRWLATERCISLCALASCLGLWLLAGLSEAWPIVLLLMAIWMFLIPVLGLISAFIFRQLEHPERDFGKIRVWGTLGWVGAAWGLTAWLALARRWSGAAEDAPTDYSDSLRVGALAALVLAFYALTLPHTPPRPRAAGSTRGRSWLLLLLDAPITALRLFRDRSFVVYVACMFAAYVTMPFTIQLNPLLLTRIGIDPRMLPTCMTVAQSMEIVMLVLLPMLLVRLGMKTTMAMGALAWTFGLSLLSLGAPTWLVFVALGSHGIFIAGFFVAGQVFVNRQATHDFRASAQGLLLLIAGVSQLLGHLLVGWIRAASDDNFALAYGIAAGVSVVLLAVFLVGFAPAPPAAISTKDALVPDSEMA